MAECSVRDEGDGSSPTVLCSRKFPEEIHLITQYCRDVFIIPHIHHIYTIMLYTHYQMIVS